MADAHRVLSGEDNDSPVLVRRWSREVRKRDTDGSQYFICTVLVLINLYYA